MKPSKDFRKTYALLSDLWALVHNDMEKWCSTTERDVRKHLVELHHKYGFPVTVSAIASKSSSPPRSSP